MTLTRQSIGASILPRLPREQMERWMLQIHYEAAQVDPMGAEEVVHALTGGRDAFCPQALTHEQMHAGAAAFLRIARLA